MAWVVMYLIVGIIVAELASLGARLEPQPFGAAHYLVGVTTWPVALMIVLAHSLGLTERGRK